MAEKFRKIVAEPEKLAKKLRQAIENTSPKEYIKKRRTKENLSVETDKNTKIKDDVAIGALSAMNGGAWLAAGGAQFLLTLARWLTLDNQFLRKMEEKYENINLEEVKKYQPQKIRSFAKKYPNLSSHIMWYFMLSVTLFGGKVAVNTGPEIVKNYKEWSQKKEDEENAKGTYAAFLNKMKPITPFLIADLIVKEGVHTDKNGLHVPYLDSNKVPTIGFGSTVLKDGTKVTMNTKPITTDEAYELARWHLEEGETYFTLYCYDVAFDNISIDDSKDALGLSSIVYNMYSKIIENPNDRNHQERAHKLRHIYKEYGYAVPDTLVKKCFEEYPVVALTSFGKAWLENDGNDVLADRLGGFLSGGRGLYWRRWLEAGMLTGRITPQMVLDLPLGGMYDFFKLVGGKKGAFFTGNVNNRKYNSDTYEVFIKWLQNPVDRFGNKIENRKQIKDFLPADVLAFCQTNKCKLGNQDFSQIIAKHEAVEKETYILGYDDMYESAIFAYQNQDYNKAVKQYENMLKKYPNNALLHNDIAATYNKLGEYDKAIFHARQIVRRIGDKSQYGAAQYNAGFAYEQKGDLNTALKNYELALKNGNKSVQADIKRIKNLLKKQKTISFNQAIKDIQTQEKASILNTKILSDKHQGIA